MTAQIPPISRLSKRVIRILGCNPGPLTLQGTNTYLIGTGGRRVLLDAGDKDINEYVNHLGNVLKDENAVIHKIIISHWHHDHIGGVPSVIKLNGKCEIAKFKKKDNEENLAISDIPIQFLKHEEIIKTEGASLKVYHTPGHTSDHIVLLLEEENVLFSGDCILGEGTTVFEDLSDYMKSLKLIENLKPEIIYPGHGPVVEDPLTKIQNYIDHRLERERQILEYFAKNKGKRITSKNIVEDIYQQIPNNLKHAAEANVIHHLSKLEKEGKVKKDCDGWSLNSISSVL